ncbi:MAG: hypothetical protein ABH830_04750 [Patescibacteria group bacterium]
MNVNKKQNKYFLGIIEDRPDSDESRVIYLVNNSEEEIINIYYKYSIDGKLLFLCNKIPAKNYISVECLDYRSLDFLNIYIFQFDNSLGEKKQVGFMFKYEPIFDKKIIIPVVNKEGVIITGVDNI